MNTRERVRISGEFAVGIVSLLFANLLSVLLFKYLVVEKIPNFATGYWTAYGAVVLFSHIIVTLGFSKHINLHMRNRVMEFMATLRNCVLTYGLISVTLALTKNQVLESRYLYISSFIFFCAFSLIGRFWLKRYMISHIPQSKLASMVGVITTVERGEKFIPALRDDWSKKVKAVALVDVVFENGVYKQKIAENNENGMSVIVKTKPISEIDGVPVVANKSNLIGWIRTASLDEVYINLPATTIDDMSDLIEELQDMGIRVNVNIVSLESISNKSKFSNVGCYVMGDYPIAVFTPAEFSDNDLIIKRIFDIVGGLVGTIISAPIILITAIPLLIESPGPLIFKQQRVGKNGRLFNIYKLRSMYVDAEERKQALMKENKMNGLMFKMDNDPRITKVGKVIRKLSIDELPQFWNVLKGDMSLVGTRPPTVDEFEKYESHHKRRLSLKPGITGMWQVSGRSNIKDFEDVVALDCEYIDNWSVFLDIKILLKTVWVVITRKGAE